MTETRFTLDYLNQIADRGVDMGDVIKVLQELKAMGMIAPEDDYYMFAVEVRGDHGWVQEQDHNHQPVWFHEFQDADDLLRRYGDRGAVARMIRYRRSTNEVMDIADVIACRMI